MRRSFFKSDFFWPLSALTLVTIGAFVGIGFAVASRLDQEQKAREETIVANGWHMQLSDAAKRVVPQLVWDEAVLNLDNRRNHAWARDNIGVYLRDVGGFNWTAVLDASDQAWFRSGRGWDEETSSFDAIEPDIALLVKQVRDAERARGALTRNSDGHVVAAPLQRSIVVVRDGGLELVTATLVQPDFGTVMPRGPRAALVLTGLPLDDAFLADFASRFMLDGLHQNVGVADFEKGEAHLTLTDASGADLKTIAWWPERPGALVLEKAAAPALCIVMVLGAAMILLYRRSRRAAQNLIASEARASHLAHHDVLTGLPNRRQFSERLAAALDEVQGPETAVAVFCIDLDRFKGVNDVYGHAGGDELIALAARRMRDMCRESDLVARLSGDEFLVMLKGATQETATACAKRLCAGLAEPFVLAAGSVFVGGTVGVLLVTEQGLAPAEALRRADLALYRAKETSKGGYCFFESEMEEAQQVRRALEADLRDAIAGEMLDMAYQPQVNSRGQMTGVEALVRWRHAERGDISPGYFVPMAEECGLIHELGMFTLRRAFTDSRRWDKLKVAVNVSATQLRMTGFVDDLAALVREMKVDPARFELEITEGILLGDDAQIQQTLQRLCALGFSLALDDFGTGYSSLSYLRRFPISKIKIDRSFIKSLGVDAEADAVVAAIVRLARALHLSVIAEGVETNEQRERLAAAGCLEVQGFLYGRPVGADTIDQMRAVRGATLEHAA